MSTQAPESPALPSHEAGASIVFKSVNLTSLLALYSADQPDNENIAPIEGAERTVFCNTIAAQNEGDLGFSPSTGEESEGAAPVDPILEQLQHEVEILRHLAPWRQKEHASPPSPPHELGTEPSPPKKRSDPRPPNPRKLSQLSRPRCAVYNQVPGESLDPAAAGSKAGSKSRRARRRSRKHRRAAAQDPQDPLTLQVSDTEGTASTCIPLLSETEGACSLGCGTGPVAPIPDASRPRGRGRHRTGKGAARRRNAKRRRGSPEKLQRIMRGVLEKQTTVVAELDVRTPV